MSSWDYSPPYAAFQPLRGASRVPSEKLHPPLPAPHDYAPQRLATGVAIDMSELGGRAFGAAPTAKSRVPHEELHPPVPAPPDYSPKYLAKGVEANMHDLSGGTKFTPLPTTASRIEPAKLHPPTPAPHDYDPKVTALGRAVDLNVGEGGIQSAAFGADRSVEPRVPSEVLHPQIPAPDHYVPRLLATGVEAQMGELGTHGRASKSGTFGAIETADSRIAHDELHPPFPAPCDYVPKCLASGVQSNIVPSSGGRVGKSGTFAPMRLAPSRVPRHVLHPPTPAPCDYRPRWFTSGGKLGKSNSAPALTPRVAAETPPSRRAEAAPDPMVKAKAAADKALRELKKASPSAASPPASPVSIMAQSTAAAKSPPQTAPGATRARPGPAPGLPRAGGTSPPPRPHEGKRLAPLSPLRLKPIDGTAAAGDRAPPPGLAGRVWSRGGELFERAWLD